MPITDEELHQLKTLKSEILQAMDGFRSFLNHKLPSQKKRPELSDDFYRDHAPHRLRFFMREFEKITGQTYFNGDLTKLHQTNAGIVKYCWQTSSNDWVRDSHEARDGKVFQ